MPSWREEWLRQLTTRADTEDAVFAALANIVRSLGFTYCAFGLRIPAIGRAPRDLWFTNFPPAWYGHALGFNHIDNDPVISAALRRAIPVVWGGAALAGRYLGHDPCGGEIRHGLTLAVHGRDQETGLLSIARADPEITSAELDEIEGKLCWLCHVANDTIQNIATGRDIGARQELSAREREVMRWTAAGKTAYEVGRILGITTRTVNFHVARVLEKLNVPNKTQAAVKATILDLMQ
jgi:LuxR family quorum-sensing system transcriptional regulator SolR